MVRYKAMDRLMSFPDERPYRRIVLPSGNLSPVRALARPAEMPARLRTRPAPEHLCDTSA